MVDVVDVVAFVCQDGVHAAFEGGTHGAQAGLGGLQVDRGGLDEGVGVD